MIDFSWFYFIGKAKLGLSFKETGHLTYTTFSKLYKHYKNDFDYEMTLRKHNLTYKEAFIMSQEDEEWL